jgi:ribosomal protein L20A (L18A)
MEDLDAHLGAGLLEKRRQIKIEKIDGADPDDARDDVDPVQPE